MFPDEFEYCVYPIRRGWSGTFFRNLSTFVLMWSIELVSKFLISIGRQLNKQTALETKLCSLNFEVNTIYTIYYLLQ